MVDASALVEVFRASTSGAQIADAMRGATLVAPSHADAEVLSAMGRLHRAGTATDESVTTAVEALTQLRLQRYPLPPLLQRAWSLRDVTSLRDALYVACTEAVDGVLLTLDRRLARSAPVEVELIG